mmetsp:Transcript_24975/g.62032  ORF Transcript_24975/g.62032 Transcript_24975/m.62032 type:complete len:232 (+) Transcript_24975:264-959(+)
MVSSRCFALLPRVRQRPDVIGCLPPRLQPLRACLLREQRVVPRVHASERERLHPAAAYRLRGNLRPHRRLLHSHLQHSASLLPRRRDRCSCVYLCGDCDARVSGGDAAVVWRRYSVRKAPADCGVCQLCPSLHRLRRLGAGTGLARGPLRGGGSVDPTSHDGRQPAVCGRPRGILRAMAREVAAGELLRLVWCEPPADAHLRERGGCPPRRKHRVRSSDWFECVVSLSCMG